MIDYEWVRTLAVIASTAVTIFTALGIALWRAAHGKAELLGRMDVSDSRISALSSEIGELKVSTRAALEAVNRSLEVHNMRINQHGEMLARHDALLERLERRVERGSAVYGPPEEQ